MCVCVCVYIYIYIYIVTKVWKLGRLLTKLKKVWKLGSSVREERKLDLKIIDLRGDTPTDE